MIIIKKILFTQAVLLVLTVLPAFAGDRMPLVDGAEVACNSADDRDCNKPTTYNTSDNDYRSDNTMNESAYDKLDRNDSTEEAVNPAFDKVESISDPVDNATENMMDRK